MKDLNREQLARHLFNVMNEGRFEKNRWVPIDSFWEYLVANNWHQGYLRLADEIVSKGYKP